MTLRLATILLTEFLWLVAFVFGDVVEEMFGKLASGTFVWHITPVKFEGQLKKKRDNEQREDISLTRVTYYGAERHVLLRKWNPLSRVLVSGTFNKIAPFSTDCIPIDKHEGIKFSSSKASRVTKRFENFMVLSVFSKRSWFSFMYLGCTCFA